MLSNSNYRNKKIIFVECLSGGSWYLEGWPAILGWVDGCHGKSKNDRSCELKYMWTFMIWGPDLRVIYLKQRGKLCRSYFGKMHFTYWLNTPPNHLSFSLKWKIEINRKEYAYKNKEILEKRKKSWDGLQQISMTLQV